FLSKEMFFTETLHQHLLGGFNWVIPAAATLAGVFSVAYSLRLLHDVFFNGEPIDLPKYQPHDSPRYMNDPVEVVVCLCLLVCWVPAYPVAPLLAAAASSTLGGDVPEYSLAVWHGLNLPLMMSFIALFGGIIVYACRKPLFRWYEGLPNLDAKDAFDQVVRYATRLSVRITNRLESGSLQRYLAWMLGSALTLTVIALSPLEQLTGSVPMTPIDPLTVTGMLILTVTAVLTVV